MQQNHAHGIFPNSVVVGMLAKETDVCFDLLFSLNLRGYCTISFVIKLARVKTLYEYMAVKPSKKARNIALFLAQREREKEHTPCNRLRKPV